MSTAEPRCWVQTLQSGYVDLIEPKQEQINWRVMSVSLSKIPRFGGHTEGCGILSVAQHCEQGARAIMRDLDRPDAAAAFVLHDGHEYVMGDIITPVAHAIAWHSGSKGYVIAGIRQLKWRLDQAIYTAAGIGWPLTPEISAIVAEYDERMFTTEHAVRCATSPFPNWRHNRPNVAPLDGVDLFPWAQDTCSSLYYAALREFLPIFGARV